MPLNLKDDPRLVITQGTTLYRIQPENEGKVRAAIAKAIKPYRKRVLTAHRVFPKFKPGMTTGLYIALYRLGSETNALIDEAWSGWHRVAPMLDPSIPECVEWEAEE